MKVRSLKFCDNKYGNQWFDEVEDRWTYDDMEANQDWKKGWISFDCSLYDPKKDLIYTGITSFDSDIFKDILSANKDMESGTLKISEVGMLKANFTTSETESEYFIARNE